MEEQTWKAVAEAFQIESGAVAAAFGHIDKEAFGAAVKALKEAPRIGASGCGHSGIACMHFAHLMCCIERPARFLPPSEALHGGMGFLQCGDVMVLASRGGKTAELIPILDICGRKGITVISVTQNLSSPMAERSNIVLKMYAEREIDRFNTQGTASFSVLNAIFDALQRAVMDETGFTPEQFALIHPGGAVGERLNKVNY